MADGAAGSGTGDGAAGSSTRGAVRNEASTKSVLRRSATDGLLRSAKSGVDKEQAALRKDKFGGSKASKSCSDSSAANATVGGIGYEGHSQTLANSRGDVSSPAAVMHAALGVRARHAPAIERVGGPERARTLPLDELRTVLAGGRPRLFRGSAVQARRRAGALLLTSETRIEVEDERKPACVAETLGMYFFNE